MRGAAVGEGLRGTATWLGPPAHRVLVTRSFPANIGTVQAVRQLGWRPVISPLLAIRPLAWATDFRHVGAIAFTSSNAVRMCATAPIPRHLPVFAVGDATARAARAAGWLKVYSAAGDLGDLVRLIVEQRSGFHGRVLHLSAREPAGDLRGELSRLGIRGTTQAVYESYFTPPNRALLQLRSGADDGMAAILVFSPKSGARLAELLDVASLPARVICISEAAAEPLRAAGSARVVVADRPDEPSMLAALGNV